MYPGHGILVVFRHRFVEFFIIIIIDLVYRSQPNSFRIVDDFPFPNSLCFRRRFLLVLFLFFFTLFLFHLLEFFWDVILLSILVLLFDFLRHLFTDIEVYGVVDELGILFNQILQLSQIEEVLHVLLEMEYHLRASFQKRAIDIFLDRITRGGVAFPYVLAAVLRAFGNDGDLIGNEEI